ncbi:MAG: AbrB/MazE/SpoVT family DNA-binding domain-containing protein [Firmicutes bacterium]|nr:AbrB/MazE/SpoVT family DNA-binding domain-containing protein [Bacillota bacterium]
MKFTGISRPIDELGRIVIPKEIRNALDMRPKDEIEIYIEDGKMIMKKAKPFCALCGNTEELSSFSGKFICRDCINKLQNFPE